MNETELKKILERQEETLTLVQKLWKAEKWRRFWAIVKYAIIAVIIIGSFYFVQPYLGPLTGLLQNVFNIQSTLKQNPQELQKLFEWGHLKTLFRDRISVCEPMGQWKFWDISIDTLKNFRNPRDQIRKL